MSSFAGCTAAREAGDNNGVVNFYLSDGRDSGFVDALKTRQTFSSWPASVRAISWARRFG